MRMHERTAPLTLIVALLALTLSACGLVPERPADIDTPAERLGEVYVGVAAAYATTAEAVNMGRISADTGADILEDIDEALAMAEVASEMMSTGGSSDPPPLRRAESLLLGVEKRLKEAQDG